MQGNLLEYIYHMDLMASHISITLKTMDSMILIFLFVVNLEVTSMNELRLLLMNVSDSYMDFVEGVIDEARKSEQIKIGVTNYLKTNSNATSSDVLKYLVDDLGLYNSYRQKNATKRMVV